MLVESWMQHAYGSEPDPRARAGTHWERSRQEDCLWTSDFRMQVHARSACALDREGQVSKPCPEPHLGSKPLRLPSTVTLLLPRTNPH